MLEIIWLAVHNMVSPHKEDDELPDKNVARDFYAKYEPKEVLGR